MADSSAHPLYYREIREIAKLLGAGEITARQLTESLDPTGKGRKRWVSRWKAPLNAFAIAFPGQPTTTRK